MPSAKTAKFFLQVQPQLTMNYPRRRPSPYQQIPSWDAVKKLARPSTCQTCLCKIGIGTILAVTLHTQ